jgi:hypothetical protein
VALLPLFSSLVAGILLADGATHELVEGPALEGHQLLTNLSTQPLVEQGCPLRIRVDMVRKVYEPLALLIHSIGPLLKVQKLLLLVIHEAIRDVVLPKSLVELNPWHLIAVKKGGGEGRPLGTLKPVELLGYE